MEEDSYSTFDEKLDSVMRGVCPMCGGELREDEPVKGEWEVSCTACEFLMVFGAA